MSRVACWNFKNGGIDAARAEGFTKEELDLLRQCVRHRYAGELAHRLTVLPPEIRERIVWDSGSEAFIPVFPDKEATLDGYFLLPIRDAVESELLHMLIVPPIATEWAIVRRNCSNELLQWLNEPVSGRALGWINVMLAEFSVEAGDQCRWSSPPINSSMAELRVHAEFWRSLHLAQRCEANLRFASVTGWVEERGMDGLVDRSRYATIRGSADDYDPEQSTFIFPVRLKRESYCLILKSTGRPFLCLKPFCQVSRITFTEEWGVQQKWLETAVAEVGCLR